MIYRFTFFASYLFPFLAIAQGINLVPNGSFEVRSECIVNDSSIEYCPPWFNPSYEEFGLDATPDVFHACVVVNQAPCPYPENPYLDPWLFGIPTNVFGCETPYEGEGYAGAFFFWPGVNPLFEFREYLAVRLIEPLQAGVAYNVSFQASLAERMTHAIWNLQVLFSPDSLVQDGYDYLHYEPQLNGTPGLYITEKNGWTPMQWTYTATGGEQFMYIGNFQANADTDTLRLMNWELGYYNMGTYYYIDAVSVIASPNSTQNRNQDSFIHVYPNPCFDNLSFVVSNHEIQLTYLKIFDLHSRIVMERNVSTPSLSINLSGIPSGCYIVEAVDVHGYRYRQKIVKR